MSKLMSWKEMPIGGVIFGGGTSQEYQTGGWRTYKPVHDEEKCIDCLLCWILCPDSAVRVEDGKVVGFDLEHCKGCGICASECPPKCEAIQMRLDDGLAV
jgi:pyruvate ferredoxin oxidoreductase delta subunit